MTPQQRRRLYLKSAREVFSSEDGRHLRGYYSEDILEFLLFKDNRALDLSIEEYKKVKIIALLFAAEMTKSESK